MTVKELIKELEKLNGEAIVKVNSYDLGYLDGVRKVDIDEVLDCDGVVFIEPIE